MNPIMSGNVFNPKSKQKIEDLEHSKSATVQNDMLNINNNTNYNQPQQTKQPFTNQKFRLFRFRPKEQFLASEGLNKEGMFNNLKQFQFKQSNQFNEKCSNEKGMIINSPDLLKFKTFSQGEGMMGKSCSNFLGKFKQQLESNQKQIPISIKDLRNFRSSQQGKFFRFTNKQIPVEVFKNIQKNNNQQKQLIQNFDEAVNNNSNDNETPDQPLNSNKFNKNLLVNCQQKESNEVFLELDSLNNGFLIEQEADDDQNESEHDFYLLADEELKTALDTKQFHENLNYYQQDQSENNLVKRKLKLAVNEDQKYTDQIIKQCQFDNMDKEEENEFEELCFALNQPHQQA